MKNHFLKSLLAPFLLALCLNASAEDIDLFVGLTTGGEPNLPNVLLILDNSANFSASATHGCTYEDAAGNPTAVAPSLGNTTGGLEQCALYNVINGLSVNDDGTAKMKIGLMAFNANKFVDWEGNKCDTVTSLGGCLMVPITAMDTTQKGKVLEWIKKWENSTVTDPFLIKTNNKAMGAVMQEAWAYFSGHTGISGRSYAAIKPVSICLKNYVIFVGNAYNNSGTPGDQTGDKGPKDALVGTNPVSDKNASPAATTEQKAIYLGPVTTDACGTYTFPTNHEGGGYYADEWARYMAASNTTDLMTYTIGVHGAGCKAEYASLLSSMAFFGGGKYFPTFNTKELEIAFESILSEVQPVNSAFASVSLPVSVNTQGTYLNQVFIGMFRPDDNALPRWAGNLKQYKMGMVGDSLKLLDADNTSAVNSVTGFISGCARSFWTPTIDDSYWFFTEQNCLGHPAISNTPDGNIVEKGAQAYTLRSIAPADRTVKTCGLSSCTSLSDFNTSNAAITKELLGVVDTERDATINWARGQNVDSELGKVTTVVRPSVHGDVVHSRPVAINFGTDAAPKVVVFYGGNDGVLRAVNGNRSAAIGSAAAGGELWSFIPPEAYPKLKRLRENTPKVSFPGSTGGEPKPYGVDGPIVAYKGASKTLIFASMRRGGDAVYAFDVTDPADELQLQWRFSGVNIGQTWSPPKALVTAGYNDGATPPTPKPMLILGGGYDVCEDADPHTCPAEPKGNKVYVLDAISGAPLKTFTTDRSVIAEVFVVPDTATGIAKYAYAADLGGNIYRISGIDANTPFENTPPGDWKMTKIASLGGTGADDARKFMFAPDVVEDNGAYVLLIGSGDREKPLTTYTHASAVDNYFFVLRDKPDDAAWLTSENATCSGDVICKASLLEVGSGVPTLAQLEAKPKGWYLVLSNSEQVVTSAITVFDTAYFSTHIPATPASADLCESNLGVATVYAVNFKTTAGVGTDPRGQEYEGTDVGLPPSPVAGMVTLDDGTKVPFCIGCNKDSPLESKIPDSPPSVARPKSRVYWYIHQ